MGWYPVSTQQSIYSRLPKVDLHRHLEGSLRVDTLMEVARVHGLTLPLRPDLRSLVQMQASDSLNFSTFLSKFQFLRLFYRSPQIIARITREVVLDAAADQVRYLELRFTPVALSRAQGFPLSDVIDWVLESVSSASAEAGIRSRLIVSMNVHEPVSLAEEVLRLAIDRKDRGIVGLDLAGNEAEFSTLPFLDLVREAKASGLSATIHAGERGGAENVRRALEVLEADRIGHGVRVMEDTSVVALARERGVPFEVCVTSNHQTGVVPSLGAHPLRRMLTAGLNVTLNTDDPSISQITLSDEYRLACEELGLPLSTLQERILAGAQAAFLPPAEKQQLVEQLRRELAAVQPY